MNKPVSKHALRRALARATGEGLLELNHPIGAVVDRLWHDITKQAFPTNGRKRGRPHPRRVANRLALTALEPAVD